MMSFTVCVALFSAVAMASVYLLDRFMAEETYSRASQPMVISSAFALLPAPLLLLCGWQMPPWEAALMAIVGGLVITVANWLYFNIQFSEVRDATEIACYESASIVIVITMVGFIHLVFGGFYETIAPHQWLGICIATLGLIFLKVAEGVRSFVGWKHRILLVCFMVFGASYEMLVDRAEHIAGGTALQSFVNVTPFYWVGMFSGVGLLLLPKERRAFREQWKGIRSAWKLIVLAEVLALVAFATALYAYAAGHVALVAMLTGCIPIFVLLGEVILRRFGNFSEEVFPKIRMPLRKALVVCIVVAGAVLANMQ